MKRRKLLKSLGLGLSAGLIMPELLLSCKKPDTGPEVPFNGTVAVIGAGAAGLYAADILRSKGIKVVIFEAGSQIGGRIRSYRQQTDSTPITDSYLFVKDTDGTAEPSIADFPLELGPELVEGSNSIWGKIMKDLTISTVEFSNATDRYILSDVAATAAVWASDPDFTAAQSFIAGLPNVTGSGVSIKAASGASDRGAPLINGLAGNRYGSSSDQVDAGFIGSNLKLAAAIPEYDTVKLGLRANLMQDVLYSRFVNVAKDVKLNTKVTAIDYSGATIMISDSNGAQTEVDKVIVTVPLSMLQSGAIAFNPGLPSSNTSSMGKFGMDSCLRVILDFKTNFWGDSNTGFIWGGIAAPQFLNAGHGRSDGQRTLTFTICGPKAAELSAMGKDMITPILAELDTIYAGNASKYIRRTLDNDAFILYTIQDWSKEPNILGGFSYPKLGATLADVTAMAAPIHGRVFFAGEATDASGNAGTVNGALSSAERVAQEVVESITLA